MRGRFTAARQVDVIEEGRRSGHREADCTHKEQQTTTHEVPSALAWSVHLGQLLVAAPGPSQSVSRFPLAAPMGRAARRGVLEVVAIVSIVGNLSSLEACVLFAHYKLRCMIRFVCHGRGWTVPRAWTHLGKRSESSTGSALSARVSASGYIRGCRYIKLQSMA